jgi:pimeloyl-ACP methyl ester carboxylesterase
VVCFHGYGEDGSSFRFLEQKAGDQYSFYCPDLPFHGYTEWPAGDPFTIDDLVTVVDSMTGDSASPFILAGFSLGGRLALGLYEVMPHRISKLVLLAPDGLKVNGWYWLATQTGWGNRFFRFTMRKPGWFMGMLRLFNRLKWVNPSIFKFVQYYIGNAAVREALYQRWTSLRKIKPGLEKIKSHIRTCKTPVELVYGKHDRIILSSVGKRFTRGIETHARLRIIESGHQVLHAKYADIIVGILNGRAASIA